MPDLETYRGIDFKFADTFKEITTLRQLARRFLTPDSSRVFEQWRRDLESIRTGGGDKVRRWQIPKESPLRTIKSKGTSEPDAQGHDLYGELCAVWDITATDKTYFRLKGLASSCVSIFKWRTEEESNPLLLARWKFEIGDGNHPGCHFHVDVSPRDSEDYFRLPVPRIPSILITPTDALDFLIGELFQAEWTQERGRYTSAMNIFAPQQRRRLVNLLTWQVQTLQRQTGSSWISLKHSKPTTPGFLQTPL